ncbi:NAD(P)H-dependent oxidoreductase [Bacteriovorax sp. PP10]|uniref:NAD(P)H-dependent oxidoreductase n=1 Tax=Bacteriovorax antarcticus TaxID=3088717 RepID=A0ABU5VSN1_9BACT|nr:NAD(P)H-dependent oxidoreductase [Bacteriovorax sp. PP10]MEA9356068.1 NAD(P)H-dependent oxidoreductase [Bacteriovorax sp. PP10]
MKKNILIIDGHPRNKSFSDSWASSYHQGAARNFNVTRISLRDLKFNPNLENGYKIVMPLEKDLIQAQEQMMSADHIVIITPIWWAGPPALLKGFFDRVMLPGFAFKYRPNSIYWDKLFQGKSGHLVVTSDGPSWWTQWLRGDSAVKMIKLGVLDFIGVKPVKVTRYGDMKSTSNDKIIKYLKAAYVMGEKGF